MRCAYCGHENSELATHCARCGRDLSQAIEDTGDALDVTAVLNIPKTAVPEPEEGDDKGDTAPRPPVIDATVDFVEPNQEPDRDTERRQQVVESSPVSVPKHARREAKVRVRDQGHKVGGFFARNQRPLAITCALIVVAVIAGVWLMLSITGKPENEELEHDLATRVPAFAYTGGAWGFDTVITLNDVKINSLEATDTPENSEVATGVGAGAYTAEAQAVYVDSHVSVTHNFTCTYVRAEEGWQPAGDIQEGVIEVEALSGVDEGKVLQNVSDILATIATINGVPLQDIYGSGNVHVADRTFTPKTRQEKATDVLVLSCHRDFSFYSYDGTVTCTFVFDNNEWGLASATCDDAASMRTNTSVLGTWSGTPIDHTASGGVCYGAEDKPLTISIDYVEDMDAPYTTVTGTISGTVHAHSELSRQQMSDLDDLEVTEIPFEGTLMTSSDAGTGAELTLEATCAVELPERASSRNTRYTSLDEEDDKGSDKKNTDKGDDEDGETSSGTSSKRTSNTLPNPTDIYEEYYLNLSDEASAEDSLELSFVMSFGTTNDPNGVFLELTSTYTSEGVVMFIVPRETQARFTDTYQLVRAS